MIEFEVRSRWEARSVACRVASIIGNPYAWDENREMGPYWQEAEQKWQLNSGNDWFLRSLGENRYSLSYRYGSKKQSALDGLKTFLEEIVFA